MMLSGRALQLNLRTVMSQQSIIPVGATEHQATVVRALSRLCGVFVTFQGRDPNNSPMRFHNPSAVVGGERTLEWSMQIGSKQWPEMSPCKSMAATMSLLKQAMGTYEQSVVCSCITPANYIADRYVIGVPTSTAPSMNFAGTSTRSRDLLSVQIRNMGRPKTTCQHSCRGNSRTKRERRGGPRVESARNVRICKSTTCFLDHPPEGSLRARRPAPSPPILLPTFRTTGLLLPKSASCAASWRRSIRS